MEEYMKKFLGMVAVLAAIALASCSVAEGISDLNGQASVETSGIGTANVQLVRAKSFIHTKYGMSQLDRTFEIRVKNLSFNKEVGVHHKLTNGTWTNLQAKYERTTADGYEIWTVGTFSYYATQLSSEFVVYATQNGVTAWDNNGGKNYKLINGDGVLLGKDIAILQSSFYYYGGSAYIYLDVKNIAFNKNIEIVYTTDNWATSSVVTARYESGYAYGYAYVQSPNKAGYERWTATAYTTNADNFKYFIKYTVNGVSYFDNNYGSDYRLF